MESERRRRRPAVYVRAFRSRPGGHLLGICWVLVCPVRDFGSPNTLSPIPYLVQLFGRSQLTHQTTNSSCILCRRRKIRCNKESPCSNCTRSKNATCVYRDPPRPLPHTRRQGTLHETGQTSPSAPAPPAPPLAHDRVGPLTPSSGISSAAPRHCDPSRPTTTAPADSTAESTVDPQSPGQYVPLERSRGALQQAASSAASPANTPVSTFTRNSPVETKTLHFAGNFHLHTEHRQDSQPHAVTRSVTHKTRMFGQSHWVTSISLVTNAPRHSALGAQLTTSLAQRPD
jgi:hypothetical protein